MTIFHKTIILLLLPLLLFSCSTTSRLEEGEQLFIGLEPITYTPSHSADEEVAVKGHTNHFIDTKAEIEAALATAPNGALFGSSYHRTPFPYGLWIWNACHGSHGVFKKWLNNSFGKAPVLMSHVNPRLRSSVAETVLKNNGYFNGEVTYEELTQKKNPKEAKIRYNVNFGTLYTIDTISYSNFPVSMYDRIVGTKSIKSGDPFSIAELDNERLRIYSLLRNHGYYYYQPSYTSYLADTINAPGKIALQLHLADSLPADAMQKWVIGKTTVQLKRSFQEKITDTLSTRFLTIYFGGKKSPIRPRILLSDLKLRPGMLFSQDAYEESMNAIASKGVFSSTDISFKKRLNDDGTLKLVADSVGIRKGGDTLDTRAGAGVLDMTVTAILDSPYDISLEANATGKTSSRLGPGVKASLTKRNAFRGGETFTLSLGAAYEFQLGGAQDMGSSYDFTASTDFNFPRLLWPKWSSKKNTNTTTYRRRRWYTTPATTINVSAELIRRANFFNRNILSTEFSYLFQPSATSVHKFTPLMVTYGRSYDVSEDYIEKASSSVTAQIALLDEMTPKMRYTYTYSSPATYRNPIHWQTTVTEAGNITNTACALLRGERLKDTGRTLFKSPISQFVKVESDIKKTWSLGDLESRSTFVLHFYGAIMRAYGNMSDAPFSEQLYIGGSNDLRGFTMRSIGPGEVHFDDRQTAYLLHNGDCKMVLNMEYRPHLFGSLYGALFMDAGNVWQLKRANREKYREETGSDPARNVAVDCGIGIRYDLDFFVIRLDWGYALHVPYKKGFFNSGKLSDAQVLNFAIGYPF